MKLDGDTLEYAAQTLEARAGNHVYRQAWRRAAKILRAMKGKMLVSQPEKLTDNEEQISSSCARPVMERSL